MKYYVIRDLKANKFQTLWPAPNDQVAIRNFKTLCNDKTTLYGSYPEDFDLFCICEFDEDNGSIKESNYSLINGSSLIKEDI